MSEELFKDIRTLQKLASNMNVEILDIRVPSSRETGESKKKQVLGIWLHFDFIDTLSNEGLQGDVLHTYKELIA